MAVGQMLLPNLHGHVRAGLRSAAAAAAQLTCSHLEIELSRSSSLWIVPCKLSAAREQRTRPGFAPLRSNAACCSLQSALLQASAQEQPLHRPHPPA